MNDPLRMSDFKCDYGACSLLSFAEVIHPEGEEQFWSYLCLFHFIREMRRRNDLGWVLAEWLYHLPLVRRIWNFWAKR